MDDKVREEFEKAVEITYGEEEEKKEEEKEEEKVESEEKEEEKKSEQEEEQKEEEEKEEEKEEEQSKDEKRKKSRFQKRIDQLVKEKHILLERNQELRNQLEEMKKQLAELKELAENLMETSIEETPEDMKERLKEIDATVNKDAGKEEENATIPPRIAAKIDKLDVKLDDARDRYADFEKLLDQRVKEGKFALPEPIIDALLECEEPGEVVYYMLKHPDEIAGVYQKPAGAQAAYIAKLEVKLKEKKASASKPKNPSAGATHKPPTPVNTAAGEGLPDPASMTEEEYFNYRRQQLKNAGNF